MKKDIPHELDVIAKTVLAYLQARYDLETGRVAA